MSASSLLRMRGLVRKEFLQILRDPSSILIAFAFPVLLLALFGYGVSLDVKDISVAVVEEHPTSVSASLLESFRASPYFLPHVFRHRAEAEAMLLEGSVQGVVVVPADFAARFSRGRVAPLQALVDGSDANTAKIVLGYVNGVVQRWQDGLARARGTRREPPVRLESHVRYNPEVSSRYFLVPGLVALLMTLIGALLTALLVSREYDRGTIEALFVTPARAGEILLGKLVPTFVLGMLGMGLTVALSVTLFGVPFRGSVGVLLFTSAFFLLAALGMGLLISTLAKNQFMAGQIAILVTFLPAFLLSNFIFNLQSTPFWVQAISYLVAARYYIAILKSIFLVGDVWSIVLPNSLALLAMASVCLGASRLLTRKRLG